VFHGCVPKMGMVRPNEREGKTPRPNGGGCSTSTKKDSDWQILLARSFAMVVAPPQMLPIRQLEGSFYFFSTVREIHGWGKKGMHGEIRNMN
jgi:hypothetical protein